MSSSAYTVDSQNSRSQSFPPQGGGPSLGRNLALELVRATEAAAVRSARWIGLGDKNQVDAAAVAAMREFLNTVDMDGVVIIGEGEKDSAPMLFNGEHLGTGNGPGCDIAVDPIDGTSLSADGRPNALSVIAASDRGTMLDTSSVFYMDKIVTGAKGRGVVHLDRPIAENLRALAKALGKRVPELRVALLDRPRHKELIAEIRAAGVGTYLLRDGDVAGGIRAAGCGNFDMCVGIGGSPEGVITACAVKALGGYMQGRLAPGDQAERERAEAAGLDVDKILEIDDLVAGDNTFFVATGVTDGQLLSGVRLEGGRICTESLVLRSWTRTIRRISAEHIL